uniref:Uncharacterized protein n=1 Tax=Rhizophora mucronata TaxID=61149 RepID=A0A2P2QTX2_RHIMU
MECRGAVNCLVYKHIISGKTSYPTKKSHFRELQQEVNVAPTSEGSMHLYFLLHISYLASKVPLSRDECIQSHTKYQTELIEQSIILKFRIVYFSEYGKDSEHGTQVRCMIPPRSTTNLNKCKF